MTNGEWKDERQRLQVQQRIVPKQIKGNIFRIRAVKYLSML